MPIHGLYWFVVTKTASLLIQYMLYQWTIQTIHNSSSLCYAQTEELPCHKPPHLSKSQILCCLSVNRTPIGSKELTTVRGTPGMSTHWPLSSLMHSRPTLIRWWGNLANKLTRNMTDGMDRSSGEPPCSWSWWQKWHWEWLGAKTWEAWRQATNWKSTIRGPSLEEWAIKCDLEA